MIFFKHKIVNENEFNVKFDELNSRLIKLEADVASLKIAFKELNNLTLDLKTDLVDGLSTAKDSVLLLSHPPVHSDGDEFVEVKSGITYKIVFRRREKGSKKDLYMMIDVPTESNILHDVSDFKLVSKFIKTIKL